MVPRYSRPEMAALWTDQTKYEIWLEVELLACEAMVELGQVPRDAFERIKGKAQFQVERIDELERTLKHDVIAFLTAVSDYIGEDSRFLHLGMTSSDVLDTGLAVVLKRASALLLDDLRALAGVLQERAHEFKMTPMIGRSHGIHAEPVTFGLKLALWYDEVLRNIERLEAAAKSVAAGKISGAVGTFANIDPRVEAFVCERLGLQAAPVSTQIVQRDRHAHFVTTLALIGATVEKFAVELRHLQRTEVLEVEESFTKGQKGSSAMPHKKNPVSSEMLTGAGRLLRGYALAALEDVALWHERDISHSSVERIILPDATILLDYSLHRLTSLVHNLVVHPENMERNMNLTGGLYYSQRVMLALAEAGLSREDAYALVQRNAMRSWETKTPLLDLLKADGEVTAKLPVEALEACFDLSYHLKHVETIFARVKWGGHLEGA